MALVNRSSNAIIKDWMEEKGQAVGYFEALMDLRTVTPELVSTFSQKAERLQEIYDEAVRKKDDLKAKNQEAPSRRHFCCFTSIDSALFVVGSLAVALGTLSDLNVPYCKEIGLVLAVSSHLLSKYNDWTSSKVERQLKEGLDILSKREKKVDSLRTSVISQKFFLSLMQSASASFSRLMGGNTKEMDERQDQEDEQAVQLFQRLLQSQAEESTDHMTLDMQVGEERSLAGRAKRMFFSLQRWRDALQAKPEERRYLLEA